MKILNNKDPNFLADLQFFLKSRLQDNNEEFDSQNTDNSFEFEVTVLVGSG